ncbi:Exopolysaccharide production protein ExoQ [Chitinispirillum alkaliphilum]|nr:Exopolysaccharide production protein ExoQ [Chitinispirillum alkaliphilum]
MNHDKLYHSSEKREKIAGLSLLACLLLNTTSILYFWDNDSDFFKQDFSGGDSLNTFIGGAIIVLIIPQLLSKKNEIFQLFKTSWPLILLFGFSLISCLWSQFPAVSFRRWVRLTITAVCILNLISEPNGINLLKKYLYSYVKITAMVSLFLITMMPQYGWHRSDGFGSLPMGFLGHKNNLGQFAAISILFLFWLKWSGFVFKKEKELKILFVCLFVLLLISQAKTSMGGFILGTVTAVTYGSMRGNYKKKAVFGMLCIFVAMTFGFLFLRVNNIVNDPIYYAVELSGRDMTFTGRTDLWSSLMFLGTRMHPVLGSGYGAFFLGEQSSWLLKYLQWQAPDAHNGFLSVFLELGFTGLGIVIFALAYNLYKIATNRLSGKKENAVLLGIFIFIIFFNMFEVGLMTNSLSFFTFIIISFYLATQKCFFQKTLSTK